MKNCIRLSVRHDLEQFKIKVRRDYLIETSNTAPKDRLVKLVTLRQFKHRFNAQSKRENDENHDS